MLGHRLVDIRRAAFTAFYERPGQDAGLDGTVVPEGGQGLRRHLSQTLNRGPKPRSVGAGPGAQPHEPPTPKAEPIRLRGLTDTHRAG